MSVTIETVRRQLPVEKNLRPQQLWFMMKATSRRSLMERPDGDTFWSLNSIFSSDP